MLCRLIANFSQQHSQRQNIDGEVKHSSWIYLDWLIAFGEK
ncbi:hypothetical protein [Enterovibrio paralichthyis]|nr:hypothetical protein [Enterovibrio paralichthyis]